MESPTPGPAPAAGPAPSPQEVLQKILDGLGLQTQVEQQMMDGSLLLHIQTAEPGRLIGKHGQALNDLQFLVNRILQRGNPAAERVIVDCERYRERQRDDIIQEAQRAAEKVRRWGEPVEIGPFSPFDRRVIHRHFAEDRELEAFSEENDDRGRKMMLIRLRQAPAAAG